MREIVLNKGFLLSKLRYDIFFDLHGVLAQLEIVSRNYDSYLARVLQPTGLDPHEVSILHDKAFIEWITEITSIFDYFDKGLIDENEFMHQYKIIDKKWEAFILKHVPKHYQEKVKPLIRTDKVEFEALAFGDPILYPDVLPALKELSKISNLRLHIASSASKRHILGAVTRHKLHEFFQEFIGYDSVQAPKKSRNGLYFKKMLMLTGASPERSIFVGDSIEEAKLSKMFGIQFIMIDRNNIINYKDERDTTLKIVTNFSELLPIILDILKEKIVMEH